MSLEPIRAALQPGAPLYALTGYKQFCVYESRPKADTPGKTDKLPVFPRDWGDSSALLTAADALAKAAEWQGANPVGVGFILLESDPFFFLDVDGCLEGGQWSDVAKRMFAALPGAAFEVSSSLTGMHMFGRWAAIPHAKRYGADRLEFYSANRLAALTGISAVGDVAVDLTAQAHALVAQFFVPGQSNQREAVAWLDEAAPGYSGPSDDDELIAKMLASTGGSLAAQAFGAPAKLTFAQVWAADEDALGSVFPPTNTNDAFDRSRADASLAARLAFWTGRNPVRMERLMRRSALERDKWERRAYIEETIERACANCDAYPGIEAGRLSELSPADQAALWTTESRDPFPTGKTPEEVVTQFSLNAEGAFRKACAAEDWPRVARQLAWKLGSNCEAVLAGLGMLGIADSPDVRTMVLAACSSTNNWASGDEHTLERLSPGVSLLGDDDQFYGAERQIEIFAGHAFVARHSKIVTPRGELYEQGAFNAMMPAGVYTLCPKDSVTKKPWEAFLASQIMRHPRVDDVAFRPDMTPGALYAEEGLSFFNTYVPCPPPRRQGDPAPFLRHIELMLPDARDRQIVLTWMAAVVQHPGKKFRWAPVLQGWEGNGKGLMQDTLQRAVGRRYTHLAQAADIGSKFNAWIVGKLLVCVNEVNAGHDLDIIDALKPMVSDDFVAVQGKGADQATARNFANFFFSTNRPAAMGKAVEGRRYAVFYTAQQSAEDVKRDMPNAYFVQLINWLNGGGYEVAIDYLATFPLVEEFNPAGLAIDAPRTSSFEASKVAALGSVEQAIIEAVAEGRQGFRGGFISSVALQSLLRDLRKENQVAPNRRRDMLKSIGYDWHPALAEGRATRPIGVEAVKGVLFSKIGHPVSQLQTPAEVMRKYDEAQLIKAEDSIFSLNR